MSNAKLRLHYFPFPGRGGAIRDALRIGRIPFEDVHVPPERFWEERAAGKFPFNTLPALEVETPKGWMTALQSNAILRYVGRLANLYPNDAVQALKADEALDLAEDINHAIGPSMLEKDPERKMAMRKTLATDTLPRFAGVLEKLLVANGRTGFAVGNALTVADLKLHWVIEKLINGSLDGIPKTLLDGYPALNAWRKHVAAVREAQLASTA